MYKINIEMYEVKTEVSIYFYLLLCDYYIYILIHTLLGSNRI